MPSAIMPGGGGVDGDNKVPDGGGADAAEGCGDPLIDEQAPIHIHTLAAPRLLACCQ